MDIKGLGSSQIPTIAELYPHLTPEEQKEAEENVMRYLEVVLRIYNRISLEREGFDSNRHK
jgi:hypothetical protein